MQDTRLAQVNLEQLETFIAACVLGAMMDYNVFYRLRWWIFGVTVVALCLCFTSLFGESVNGAARWISLKKIGLRVIHFQPSEFAKLTAAIVLAGWFARQEPLTREFPRATRNLSSSALHRIEPSAFAFATDQFDQPAIREV